MLIWTADSPKQQTKTLMRPVALNVNPEMTRKKNPQEICGALRDGDTELTPLYRDADLARTKVGMHVAKDNLDERLHRVVG